ncbi:hypothetical protein RDABS01_039769 [Bienertia sinuspersici]
MEDAPFSFSIKGGPPTSIWLAEGSMQSLSAQSALQTMSRMYTMVSSPMSLSTQPWNHEGPQSHSFSKISSIPIILHGTPLSIGGTTLVHHGLALLAATNKYDIMDLKEACEESLLEDINLENVLERLQEAWLYQLDKLKKGRLTYLFDFGKIHDIKDELNNFFQTADRKLLSRMFLEALNIWKPV